MESFSPEDPSGPPRSGRKWLFSGQCAPPDAGTGRE